MAYKALTYINLPLLDIKKAPGDTVSDEELAAGGQTEEDIQALITGGALSENMDADLHPDHQPIPLPLAPTEPDTTSVVATDEGKGVPS